MVKKTIYCADDGTEFSDENECYEYEEIRKKERKQALQRAIKDLDSAIWNKYYPESDSDAEPQLDAAHVWLKNDIMYILSDENIQVEDVKEDIVQMILATEYGNMILNECISMESVMREVAIRRDFGAALKNVQQGSLLSGAIQYALGPRDLKQLALLHQAGKYRKKIEELLTDCNFHYECEKFSAHDYKEFIKNVG